MLYFQILLCWRNSQRSQSITGRAGNTDLLSLSYRLFSFSRPTRTLLLLSLVSIQYIISFLQSHTNSGALLGMCLLHHHKRSELYY